MENEMETNAAYKRLLNMLVGGCTVANVQEVETITVHLLRRIELMSELSENSNFEKDTISAHLNQISDQIREVYQNNPHTAPMNMGPVDHLQQEYVHNPNGNNSPHISIPNSTPVRNATNVINDEPVNGQSEGGNSFGSPHHGVPLTMPNYSAPPPNLINNVTSQFRPPYPMNTNIRPRLSHTQQQVPNLNHVQPNPMPIDINALTNMINQTVANALNQHLSNSQQRSNLNNVDREGNQYEIPPIQRTQLPRTNNNRPIDNNDPYRAFAAHQNNHMSMGNSSSHPINQYALHSNKISD